MWMYVLMVVFFGAGYALGKSQNQTSFDPSRDASSPSGREGMSREDQFGHLKPILLALYAFRGQSLDTAHMDELLEISELNSEETKRSRRARIVSDVNAWGWTESDRPVLTRLRDEEDRRRTLYVVDEFNLPSWARSEISADRG
jgi:hypothetical protein